MAKSKKTGRRPVPSKNGGAPRKRIRAARKVEQLLGADDIKHLPKAPGDYKDVARKFADALDATKFRSPVSAAKLRSLVRRAERLTQVAEALEIKATNADRRRMLQDSQAWKGMLLAWRLVVAAMPDSPQLEPAFAFMQEYMSVGGKSPAKPQPPAAQAS